MLLLRNGNLLCGKITQAGEWYDVAIDLGQIHVKAADVEFRCRTIEEVYQYKRRAMQWGDAWEHLQLAQWCQRYGLLQLAARELAEARAVDPAHPMIPLLERRIAGSLCQPEPAGRPAEPAAAPPPPEELDGLVRQMPPGSVERFTQVIQPLLVNHCAAAGCHGPGGETRFKLLRIPSNRPSTRRLTQRNLQSVLEQVDRDNPAASKLLAAASQPHGSARQAVFSDQQSEQYRRLEEWVYGLSRQAGLAERGRPASPVPQSPQQVTAPTAKPPWLAALALRQSPNGAAGPDGTAADPAGSPPDDAVPQSQVVPAAAIFGLEGLSDADRSAIGQATGFLGQEPADPFDAAVFNRRYFPGGPPPSP